MAKLRPRARIIRTIGDQLISGPEAALIELVKNSYDADASRVSIVISPRSVSSRGEIIISDDGHGMSNSDILEKWLEPATDNKLNEKNSPRRRALLGAKGIGRFAASRLGRNLWLKTISLTVDEFKNEKSELVVDWDEFDSFRYLDEIELDVKKNYVNARDSVSGVDIVITNLRDDWTKKQLEQLVHELRRLLSPVGKDGLNFKIFLDLSAFNKEIHGFSGQEIVSGWSSVDELSFEADADANEVREVKPFKIQNIYHYRVEGEFDLNGSFTGFFKNWRAKSSTVQISIPGPTLTAEELDCGFLTVQLNVYDREGSAIQELFESAGERNVGRMNARRLLDENIGIGIYRNNFRIRPYGDSDTDWLELETKRVQNPSLKIGISQVWGLVDVSAENVSGLVERSSREGFEHNGSFLRLKRLITELLAYVENLRRDYREKTGLSRKAVATTAVVQTSAEFRATQKAVLDLPVKFRERVQKALLKDKELLKTAIEDLETYQQSLASRSTLGLVVSQVLHDGRRFLADISTRSNELIKGESRLLEQSRFGEHFRGTFGKNAMLINASAGELAKLFKALDPVSGRKRGSPKIFNPVPVVRRCLTLFDDYLNKDGIKVNFQDEAAAASVYGYESDLVAAVLNIVDNGVYWLGSSKVESKYIKIKFHKTVNYVRLSISNNGPEIDRLFVDKLFSPGFTLKTEGSGIGLAIAREALRSSKWDLAFDGEADETCFVIEMNRK